MAKKFIKPGDVMTLACPYATVSSGQGVLVGMLFGVAMYNAVITQPVECAMEGVWELDALSTDTATQGQLAYWDNTNRRLTVTSTGNTLVGTFGVAKGNGDTVAQIKLQAINSAASPDIALSTVVTVSSAELLALHTTPKTLVAAPAAGTALVLVLLELFYDYGSAAYAGESIRVTYAGGSFVTAEDVAGFMDQTSDRRRIITPSVAVAPEAAAALVLTSPSANTTGNGILKVRVHYRTVTLLT